jgi:uncharacterized protein DUF1153
MSRNRPGAYIVNNTPPSSIRRWVASRKAAVIAAVRDGKITMEETLHCYQLTEEEFLSWQRAFESHGLSGLKIKFMQRYREPHESRRPGFRRHQNLRTVPKALEEC